MNQLNKMRQYMSARNYSPRTIDHYIFCVQRFIEQTNTNASHASANAAKEWLQTYPFSSISQQNIYINAIKLFFIKIRGIELKNINLERPRKEEKLPVAIAHKTMVQKINAIANIKHRAILQLAYTTGMRVSEIINCKIADIDSARMVVRICQSKGRKDRYAPLTPGTLQLLRKYAAKFKPKHYLFNGQNSPQYTATSCNKLVKKYIGQQYHFHQLRHSCFTNMLENGTDLRTIQQIAGHKKITTTQIYTHVSNKHLHQAVQLM